MVESSGLSMDVIDVSRILLELPHLIHESESRPQFSFRWGVKRKRSANGVTQSLPPLQLSSSSSPSIHQTCDAAAPTCKTGPPKASSPATPLSFSPSESDDKHSKRKVHVKRKKEEWLEIMDGLTQRNELLKGEIENVKRYYDELKAFNLKLKAKKLDLTLELQRGKHCLEMMESPNLAVELAQPNLPTLRNGSQKQQISSMLHQTVIIKSEISENSQYPYGQTFSWLSSSPVLGPVSDHKMGPFSIPDLNVSPDESFVMGSAQPFDLNMVNKSVSRAMAAQARRERIQICRLKNYNAACRQRYLYR